MSTFYEAGKPKERWLIDENTGARFMWNPYLAKRPGFIEESEIEKEEDLVITPALLASLSREERRAAGLKIKRAHKSMRSKRRELA